MSARDFASLTHTAYGDPIRWWHYTDTFAVADLIGKDGIISKRAIRNGDHCYWHDPMPPWPLYRAAALLERPDAPVLVLQSEKAAEAAVNLFADHVCVTWPGGSHAVNQADVLPLLGRDVVLWPENDGRGATAMARLRVRLGGVARAVVVLDLPRTWPRGWDVAWPLPSGVTQDVLRTLLCDAGAAFCRPERSEEFCRVESADDGADEPPPPPRLEQQDAGAREEAPDVAPSPRDDSRGSRGPVPRDENEDTATDHTMGAHDGADPAQSRERLCHEPPDTNARGAIAHTDPVTFDPDVAEKAPAPDATATPVDDWPTPDLAVLEGRRPDLPPFPLDVLPPFWCAWTQDTARHADAPVDGVALSLLTTAASLIGTARCVAPTRSWTEPCTLWTALVGSRAAGTVAGMDAVRRLVGALDRDLAAANIAARCRDITAREHARAEGWWWRESVRGAVANHRTAPTIPVAAHEPPPFAARRLVIGDPATDAVADALLGSPRGTLLVRSALGDWFGQMRRDEDRERWLGAWSADRWIVPRRGRVAGAAGRFLSFRLDDHRTIEIAQAAVCVLGAISPDAIAAALASGNDGMAAHMLFTWPQEVAFQLLSDTPAPPDDAAAAALARLRDMADAPRTLPLAADALAWFDDFRRAHHRKAAGLDGWTADWWRHGLHTIVRLAGVLAMIEWVAQPAGTAEPACVTMCALKAAATLWQTYLWPHARAVCRIAGGSDLERHADDVLQWLRTCGASDVSREELRTKALRSRCNAATTQRIADSLVAAGWLRPVKSARDRAGRPPIRWTINPLVQEARDAC